MVMVRWYHLILSAYGFWLPNDPRGSWSEFVHVWELFRFGGSATTVGMNRSFAKDSHDARSRRNVKEHLKYRPARFDEACRESIARGFARACEEFGFAIHACAIGFDHAHLIVARDANRDIENVASVLKARATSQMTQDRTHPMQAYQPIPSPWARKSWSVFVNEEPHLRSAINYINRHPVKEGLPPQRWSFIRLYPSV